MGSGRSAIGRAGGALALLAAVALPGGLALADGTERLDPTGDAAPAFTDIRRVSATHGKGGRLRHTIYLVDADAASRSLAQLTVRARGKLYLIDARGVTTLSTGSSARKVARVRRRGNRIVFTFHRRLIGNPRRYRWLATVGSNDTSPGEFDRAPDRGMVLHRLR